MSALGYYRQPTISGDVVVFVCEDDLWSVPISGGVARRLTAGRGEVALPRLSPDGAQLAFVASEDGSPELYVMPAEGGPPRRTTFLGGRVTTLCGWSRDGAWLHFTSDARGPFASETRAFRVPAAGGEVEELGLGDVRTFDRGGDGRFAIGRNAEDPARWKRYRGGTAGDLWVEREAGDFGRLIALPGNPVWPMRLDERIVFLSDHEGVANLYEVGVDGTGLRRLTNETTYFARHPATDGSRVVYGVGGEIALLDLADGTTRRIEIRAPSSAPQTARRFVDAADDLEEFSPSPDGTSLAFVSRGRPFTMPLWEEATTAHGLGSGVRYRETRWLSSGDRFVCTSDAGGEERLEIHDAKRREEPRVVAAAPFGRAVELATSPTADVVALANHRHELVVVDLADGKTRVLDRGEAGRARDLAFSPDGRWLAYAISTMHDTSVVRIAKIKSGNVHDVTPLLRSDWSPAWDPEGKYLYFLSTRDFNPVYDALQFDLGFPQASRPFAIALRPDVASPFVPKPAPLHKDGKDDDEDGDDDGKDEKTKKPPKVEIDFDGIAGRIVGFPVEEGSYGDLVAVRGRVLYTRYPVRGIDPAGTRDDDEEPGALFGYDLETRRESRMHGEVAEIRLGADARTLVYRSNERLRAIDALGDLPGDDDDDAKDGGAPSRRTGWLDLSRASVRVEPVLEWAQMYHEAWRLQGEQFWDAEMSGVDWTLVRDRYAALLPKIRTRGELSDLIWEMQGELGTSHAYESGGDRRRPPQYRRGFLGADLRYDADAEGYRILRILRGDSWNRDVDSPLAEMGLAIAEGDVIHAIGGVPLTRDLSPDEALVNAAGRDLSLVVGSGKKERRRVLVRALRDERMLRYRAWVEANRKFVHDRTNGDVGYLHIPDMGPWGFAEFHRGYLSEFARPALLVDVRYNRGGHVSPLLLEKLARKRVGYDVPRYGPPVPYPPESVAGPIVAMTNQFAGSDGDIFSHCFKLYGLGPLVGKRTWGGVIGISPYHALVDGTETTQPEFSFWFTDVGWRVENYGTDPDFDVDIRPQDARDGSDPQMEKALELIAQARERLGDPAPRFDPRPRLPIPLQLP